MINIYVEGARELGCYTARCCETPVSAAPYYLFLHPAIVYNYDEKKYVDKDKDSSGNKR